MNKIIRAIIILVVVLIIIIGIIILYKRTNFHTFKLDSDSKYIVTTTTDIATDGGTKHTINYEIDLSKNKIEKRQDYYKAQFYFNFFDFLVGNIFSESYYGKLLDKGTITEKQGEELKELLDNRIAEGDYEYNIKEEGIPAGGYYYVSSINAEKVIMSNEDVSEFKSIVSRIFLIEN